MADSKVTALTALTALTGDETLYIVEDDDGTPVSRQITIENLAAGLAALSGYGSFVRKVRQTLTDKTSFAGTGDEQWGTEEATLDDASLPALTSVTVEAHVLGYVADLSSNTASLLMWVEISLDGGSSWTAGLKPALRRHGDGVTSDRFHVHAAHELTGTVSGDIQARAMASCSAGAGSAFDLLSGAIYMDVIRSA